MICFCCKQNTAYEMRISDWSSDVCSSDLTPSRQERRKVSVASTSFFSLIRASSTMGPDRKSVVKGKSVSVRVDLGGRRIIKTQTSTSKSSTLYRSSY